MEMGIKGSQKKNGRKEENEVSQAANGGRK